MDIDKRAISKRNALITELSSFLLSLPSYGRDDMLLSRSIVRQMYIAHVYIW